MSLFYVAAGGAIGALARYGLTGWLHGFLGEAFPWGTLSVNVLGSLALGVLLVALEQGTWSPEARRFAAIGVLGAFTTFSTFTYETVALWRDGEWLRGGAYVAGSLLLGLAAIVAGFALASALIRARG